jgi:DNA-binding SARP family transcriptional activator/EAL domain-containing protein (putative c-di-GMP-specific phosphodiesterase class I)/FixJ family two-component response regulator
VSPAVEDGRRRLVVLGGQRIEAADGSGVTGLPGRRAELVFSYLVVERRRPVSREELADALWPDQLPESWAAALRGVITEVRRFLSSGGFDVATVLVSAGNGWQLRLPADVTVDLDETRDALEDARTARASDDHAAAAAAAERAADLAALPFLPDHEAVWAEELRTELKGIRAAAWEIAAREYGEAGDSRSATGAAERLVRADPYDEASHRLLIDVLGRAGDVAGATRAYERCRELLRAELGAEPSAATQSAFARAANPSAGPPAGAPLDAGASGPTRTPIASALAGYVVLVVEDHDFQRRFALTLLRRLGIEKVDEAKNGRAALERLTAEPAVDVLLCDLAMPGMDGVELIRHVAERQLVRAVAITSGLDRGILETVRSMAERYGVQVLSLVEKPLSVAALTLVLSEYRPSATQQHDAGSELSGDRLRAAIADDRIAVHLSPIVDLARGALVAADMVAYWRDTDAGPPAPLKVSAASLDDDRVVERLGRRLAALGLAAAAALATRRMPLEAVVRLPHQRFRDPALADRLSSLSRAQEVPTRRLVLAVGENAAGDGSPATLESLARLRVRGFSVWLDDVGPNARLADGPFTGVRLAPSLVDVSPTDGDAVDLLRRAVERAREHSLTVVGNGCTRAEHVEMLLDVGAGRAQGSHIAPPMVLDDFVEWAGSWDSAGLFADG